MWWISSTAPPDPAAENNLILLLLQNKFNETTTFNHQDIYYWRWKSYLPLPPYIKAYKPHVQATLVLKKGCQSLTSVRCHLELYLYVEMCIRHRGGYLITASPTVTVFLTALKLSCWSAKQVFATQPKSQAAILQAPRTHSYTPTSQFTKEEFQKSVIQYFVV